MSTKFEFENLEDQTEEQKEALKDEFSDVFYPTMDEFKAMLGGITDNAGIALDAAVETVLQDMERKQQLDPKVAEHLLPIHIDNNLHKAFVRTGKLMSEALIGKHQHKSLTDANAKTLRSIKGTTRKLNNASLTTGTELNSIVRQSDYMSYEQIEDWAKYVVLSACLNRVTKDKLHQVAVDQGDQMISAGLKELKGNELYDRFVEAAKDLKGECKKIRSIDQGYQPS